MLLFSGGTACTVSPEPKARFEKVTATTDADGIIIHCNKAAERVFEANDGLCIERTGAIATGNPTKSSELHKAIRDAMTVLDDVPRPLGQTITVERKSGRQPYSVLAAPLWPRTGSFGAQRALALVIISDPDRGHRLDPGELSRSCDITISEARSSACWSTAAASRKPATRSEFP